MARVNICNKIIMSIKQLSNGEYRQKIDTNAKGDEQIALQELERLRAILLEASAQRFNELKETKIAVASIAHDFKTPLAVMLGYVECIQDGLDDKDYLNLLKQKIENLNQQVLQLVDAFVKSENTEKIVEKVNACEYFYQEFEKYKEIAIKKNILYKISKIPKVFVYINKEDIAHIIQNIVSNAINYTSNGGRVKIKFKVWNHNLEIKVIDNGIGISKDAQGHVFDKFYREDKSRTKSNFGLGLYISKNNAQEHGGDIFVKSKKGKGSVFKLILPYYNTEQTFNVTNAFDNLPFIIKFCAQFFFGFVLSSFYRLAKAISSKSVSTAIGGVLALPMFMFFWFIDIVSICTSGKIQFLAD